MNANTIVAILAAVMIAIIICYDIRMMAKLKNKSDANKIPMPETLEEKVEFANQMSKLALDIQKVDKELGEICCMLRKPIDNWDRIKTTEDGDKDGDWVADNEPKDEPIEVVHPHMALSEDVWTQHFADYEVLDIVYYSDEGIAIDDDNDQLYDASHCETLFGGPEMLEKALKKSNSNNTCYIRNFHMRKDICIHIKTIKGERNNEA